MWVVGKEWLVPPFTDWCYASNRRQDKERLTQQVALLQAANEKGSSDGAASADSSTVTFLKDQLASVEAGRNAAAVVRDGWPCLCSPPLI